ncbi:NADH:flavin oxidoreductase [Agrobacterium sp. NPDC090273]|uniref:NADH:flavin oxidoreductase n=1 Tax=Agrobacterium sp. NPDC090273 TaxID=3363919 RepID=UPI00383A88BC
MSVSDLFEPVPLLHGAPMKNRFMLGPLTNRQSEPDGLATDYDVDWVTRAARGGYALTQTCATTVEAGGKTFLGQLGIHDDRHLAGLKRMAEGIRRGGSLSAVQIHHGGHRVDPALGGIPAAASDDPVSGARAMSIERVEELRDSYIMAAVRAEQAGFDGVVLHGAFGFALSQFLSPALNRRSDRYGGSLENRSRIIFEIIDGIRKLTGPSFQVGLRLSVERFGLDPEELRDVAAETFRRQAIDYLDLALWDSKQRMTDLTGRDRTTLSLFTELSRNGVKVGSAGKIMSAKRAGELVDEGCDFVVIGRAAILHADFPHRVRDNPEYVSPTLPVTKQFLEGEGLSPPFIEYMRSTWPNFVDVDAA